MAERRAETTQIGSAGTNYAKVAERLKLFRQDWKNSKTETAYEFEVEGSVVFTVWIWKDKTDLLDLMKAGVTDKESLRASADANGNAKGMVGQKEKDFEKLESIALGRALAMLGYLASGEIASFEEMEEFEKFRKQQQEAAVQDAIKSLKDAKTIEDLKKAFIATKMMENPLVVAAKDKRKSELMDGQPAKQPKPPTTVKAPPVKPTEVVEGDVVKEPALPLETEQ